MVQTVHIAHMPAEVTVFATVFQNIENAAFLREQLLAGNTEFSYAFIDASMILSRKQVLAAVFRAMNDYLHDRLKSHNIHSEIVFSLNPSPNIGEAFRKFGITDSTINLVVLKIGTGPETTEKTVSDHLTAHVKGQECPFDDETFSSTADLAKIRKAYKITVPTGKAANKTTDSGTPVSHASVSPNGVKFYETQILGAMALRGAT